MKIVETETIHTNVKFSSTQLFDFVNYTVETTPPVTVEEQFQWTNAEIARLIHIIIRRILIVMGTIGNCLTFYIIRRTSLKDISSCFYISVLALADMGKYSLFYYLRTPYNGT